MIFYSISAIVIGIERSYYGLRQMAFGKSPSVSISLGEELCVMTALTSSSLGAIAPFSSDSASLAALTRGEVLLKTQPHTAWGAAVTARMFLPIARDRAWEQLTNYPRWAEYLPALTRSEVLFQSGAAKRLCQAASKSFLIFTAHVEIYLNVLETAQHRILFQLESGSFKDFLADLRLYDHSGGTMLSYTVQATPSIPVPSLFIEQAIQLDLPANLRYMRQVLCAGAA